MTQAHILVAISDQQITFLLERVLKSAGYAISLQENPASIQRTVELNPPTLIILGETVGNASGMEIAAALLRRFPAIPVLLYQGALTLCAGLLSPVLQGELLRQICAAGYLMVGCIGVNFLSESYHIKVANFLPGLLVPPAWAALRALAAALGWF